MVYLGSKRLLAKEMIPVMADDIAKCEQYVEPFVGGANMIDKVRNYNESIPLIGYDINKYVIATLCAIRDGWTPPYINRHLYYQVKENKDSYAPEVVGFVGICCSYGGKWFDCFARSTGDRDYIQERTNTLVKQRDSLKGIEFYAKDYLDIKFNNKTFIYCDPPYKGQQGYAYSGKFNHKVFWLWAKIMKKRGHIVYVSESEAPDWATLVFEKSRATGMKRGNAKKSHVLERLYKL